MKTCIKYTKSKLTGHKNWKNHFRNLFFNRIVYEISCQNTQTISVFNNIGILLYIIYLYYYIINNIYIYYIEKNKDVPSFIFYIFFDFVIIIICVYNFVNNDSLKLHKLKEK